MFDFFFIYYFWLLRVTEMQNDGLEPEFLSAMKNVTVALGREAILVCSVKNIGEHKVSTQVIHF